MWHKAVTQHVQRTLWGCQPLTLSICQTESKLDLSMDGTVLRGAGWAVGQDVLPNCQQQDGELRIMGDTLALPFT